jgi:hypothetical protein
MLTHPIVEEAVRFYMRFGFIASPLREQQLAAQECAPLGELIPEKAACHNGRKRRLAYWANLA